MPTLLTGGRVHDPINGVDGEVRDIWVDDGRIVAAPPGGRADATHDLAGCIVMPGGIDLHSHIGGGKVNIARMLMPEEHRRHLHPVQGGCRCGSGEATPSTFSTGYAYARHGKGRLMNGSLWALMMTRMTPSLALILPFFIVFRSVGLIDTRTALVIAYCSLILPLSSSAARTTRSFCFATAIRLPIL